MMQLSGSFAVWRRRFLTAVLACAGSVQTAEWPQCQEQSTVLRHNGRHGIFVDLVPVGAKEGCWQNDCTKTDKFVCPSPAECAAACAQVDICRFWTYEPGIVKCFMRSSDEGREANPEFVSGTRDCLPPNAHVAAGKRRVAVPFAQAALWAAELPALRPCDGGIGAAGCENPYAAMAVWRYAVNNLRLIVASLPESEKQQHASTLQYIQQIAGDIANFYRQPTGETFQVAVTNTAAVFGALSGWLRSAPAVELEVEAAAAPAAAMKPVPVPNAAGASPAEWRAQLADGREMPMLGFGTWQLMGQQAYDE